MRQTLVFLTFPTLTNIYLKYFSPTVRILVNFLLRHKPQVFSIFGVPLEECVCTGNSDLPRLQSKKIRSTVHCVKTTVLKALNLISWDLGGGGVKHLALATTIKKTPISLCSKVSFVVLQGTMMYPRKCLNVLFANKSSFGVHLSHSMPLYSHCCLLFQQTMQCAGGGGRFLRGVVCPLQIGGKGNRPNDPGTHTKAANSPCALCLLYTLHPQTL